MIRAFVAISVSLISTAAVADTACDAWLSLSCRALYRADNNVTSEFSATTAFADGSCTAQVEIVNGNSTLQVIATQDPENQVVNYSAKAIHNDANGVKQSKGAHGYASPGMAMNFGFISLPVALDDGQHVTRDALLSCIAK